MGVSYWISGKLKPLSPIENSPLEACPKLVEPFAALPLSSAVRLCLTEGALVTPRLWRVARKTQKRAGVDFRKRRSRENQMHRSVRRSLTALGSGKAANDIAASKDMDNAEI
jgi:hypothetical protein